MTSFYNEEELKKIGLKSYGENVLISRNAKLYGVSNISIGNNVRIDDFCVLSGKIEIENNVHIAAGVYIFAGSAGVIMKNFSGISSRSAIYAASDDYSGNYMTNPTVPDDYKNVIEKQVIFEEHALVGTGCTILPGVTIGFGAAVGSMSLVNKSIPEFKIYAGIPARFIKDRSNNLIELSKKYIDEQKRFK